MTELPSFENYMGNGRDNALSFSLAGVDVYFSYRTPVAFRAEGRLVVRENTWGPTTGKHLNAIDGGSPERKKARVSGDEFSRLLDPVLCLGVQT